MTPCLSINQISPPQFQCHKSLQQTHQQTTIIGPSSKKVTVAAGKIANTSTTTLLPLTQLCPDACCIHTLPVWSNNVLLSARTLAKNYYVTLFHPGSNGGSVQYHNDMTIITTNQPYSKGAKMPTGPCYTCQHVPPYINNLYVLPSTEHGMLPPHHPRNPNASHTTVHNLHSNLTMFPSLVAATISKHLPESDGTQRGHNKQIKQGTIPPNFKSTI